MACGDQKDSTRINVRFNPYISVSTDDLKATELIYNDLNKRADLISKAVNRLEELKKLTDVILINHLITNEMTGNISLMIKIYFSLIRQK